MHFLSLSKSLQKERKKNTPHTPKTSTGTFPLIQQIGTVSIPKEKRPFPLCV